MSHVSSVYYIFLNPNWASNKLPGVTQEISRGYPNQEISRVTQENSRGYPRNFPGYPRNQEISGGYPRNFPGYPRNQEISRGVIQEISRGIQETKKFPGSRLTMQGPTMPMLRIPGGLAKRTWCRWFEHYGRAKVSQFNLGVYILDSWMHEDPVMGTV